MIQHLNLGRIQKAIDDKRLDGSQKITEEALRKAGLVHKSRDGVRVLRPTCQPPVSARVPGHPWPSPGVQGS